MKTIFIALDGGKKLSLGSQDTFYSKKFRLRTVDKNQFQARINVEVSDDGNDYVLHSSYLEKLKCAANGYSYLDCHLEKVNRTMTLIIKNSGKVVCRESFSVVPRQIRLRNLFWILGILLSVCGLTALLLMVDFSSIFGTTSFGGAAAGKTNSSQITGSEERDRGTSQADQTDVTKKEEAPSSFESKEPGPQENRGIVSETPADSGDDVTPSEGERQADEERGVTVEIKETSPDFTRVREKDLTLLFTPNSSRLTVDTVESLKNVLPFLLEYPSLHVKITGHCAIAGTEVGRKEISVQRARNVETWLRGEGWEPEIPPEVRGEAGNYPLTMDPDLQEINRRVEIDIAE